jgi:hypothetical protein
MTPLGGWEGRAITGTAGVPLHELKPRQEGSVPASAQTASGDRRVDEMRAREARVEDGLLRLSAGSPKHAQVARGLQAAKVRRRKIEREAAKG